MRDLDELSDAKLLAMRDSYRRLLNAGQPTDDERRRWQQALRRVEEALEERSEPCQ